MKKILIGLVVLILVTMSVPVQGIDSQSTTAIGPVATSGQVTCNGTIATVKAPTTTGRLSLTIQNLSGGPVVPVYLSPLSTATTSTAGILLDTTRGMTYITDRASGDVSWYCITGGSSATVGWTETKRQ